MMMPHSQLYQMVSSPEHPVEQITLTYLSIGEALEVLKCHQNCPVPKKLTPRRLFQCLGLVSGCTSAINFIAIGVCLYLNYVDVAPKQSERHQSLKLAVSVLTITFIAALSFTFSFLCLSCFNVKPPCTSRIKPSSNNEINAIFAKHAFKFEMKQNPCDAELLYDCRQYLDTRHWKKIDFTQLEELSENYNSLAQTLINNRWISDDLTGLIEKLEDLKKKNTISLLKDPLVRTFFQEETSFIDRFIQAIPISNLPNVIRELTDCIEQIPRYNFIDKGKIEAQIYLVADKKQSMNDLIA